MLAYWTVVLDVGKTLAKLTLWDQKGALVERRTRPNKRVYEGRYLALDATGIETWVMSALADFARMGPVGAIIPVAHGAGVVILRDGRPACAPMDYEEPVPPAERERYEKDRDPFALTGSPALPDGLNLGVQLHRLEQLAPEAFQGDVTIMPWAQYWGWLLSGVACSELTSLGCHTDLWRPMEQTPSALAKKRGWADKLAPLRAAGDCLGVITPQVALQTGLEPSVVVYCGLHDSNAALLAARGFPEIADHEATILSTGTWFVAMRSPGRGTTPDLTDLPEQRDCLVNIDVHGKPLPSARFMGGREIEILSGIDSRQIDIAPDQPRIVAALPDVLATGAMILPTLAAGVGPYPHGRGRWLAMPEDHHARRAAVCLYAALVADASLDLIGARERLLIEGRFADAEVFVRALATLRPNMAVYVSHAHNGVPYGALRLIDPCLSPPGVLRRVQPLAMGLTDYKARWRTEAERSETVI